MGFEIRSRDSRIIRLKNAKRGSALHGCILSPCWGWARFTAGIQGTHRHKSRALPAIENCPPDYCGCKVIRLYHCTTPYKILTRFDGNGVTVSLRDKLQRKSLSVTLLASQNYQVVSLLLKIREI